MKITIPYTQQEYLDFIEYCNLNRCKPHKLDDGWESVEIEPSKEEKLKALDGDYQNKKSELKSYYMDFFIANDLESAEEIKEEMAQLDADYAEEYKAIKESDNNE